MVNTEKIKKLGKELIELSTEETLALKTHLEEFYDLKIVNPQPITIEQSTADTEEKQTEFNVVLEGYNNNSKIKMTIIKEYKVMTGKNLIESKTIIEDLPVTLAENVSIEEAESTKQRFEKLGGQIIIK